MPIVFILTPSLPIRFPGCAMAHSPEVPSPSGRRLPAPCSAFASPACQIGTDVGTSCPNTCVGAGERGSTGLCCWDCWGQGAPAWVCSPRGASPQGHPFLLPPPGHCSYKMHLSELQFIKQRRMHGCTSAMPTFACRSSPT